MSVCRNFCQSQFKCGTVLNSVSGGAKIMGGPGDKIKGPFDKI